MDDLKSATAHLTTYSWHESSHLWHTSLFFSPVLHRLLPKTTRFLLRKRAALLTGGTASTRSTEDSTASPWARRQLFLSECQVLSRFVVLVMCLARWRPSFLANLMIKTFPAEIQSEADLSGVLAGDSHRLGEF